MAWEADFCDPFVAEFRHLDLAVQEALLTRIVLLRRFGPALGRPHVDTLNSSRHANMKELRFSAERGIWRFAFAFDPQRRAIVMCGGDKSGCGEDRFYRRLIAKADRRFDAHLEKQSR